jgi:NADPH-dependent 2,4-dienoyl-CoA reductase/sulfur reductase-like enzyme
LETTRDSFHYDKLIVGTGSRAKSTERLGLDPKEPRVWQLRTVEDVRKIHRELETFSVRRVAVIGGGYVGLEAAEALCRRGLQVTIFHQNSTLVRLDDHLNCRLLRILSKEGVEVCLDSKVERVELASGLLTSTSPDGPAQARFDAFLTSCGIEPEADLLIEAGARTGQSGAVMVSARGETGLNGVYACGDGVEVPNSRGGPGHWIPLATTAARLGRICGENAAGGSRRLGTTLAALAVRVFGLELGLVGLPQDWEACRKVRFEWGEPEHPFPRRRQGRGVLYVDRQRETLKGIQVLCPEASKLVDLAGLCVEQELTLSDLQDLDYCYNPPLSSLWHPFYLASRVGEKESTVGERYEFH